MAKEQGNQAQNSGGNWLMWIIALMLLAVVVWWWLNRDESKQDEQARDVLRDTEEHMRQALRRAMERLEQALDAVDDAPAKPAQAEAPTPEPAPTQAEAPAPEPAPTQAEAPAPEPAPTQAEAPAPEPAPVLVQEADDLTKINGIGPAYRDILHRAGITTFAALANLTSEQIDDIIRKGGGRRAPSSATWVEQARQAVTKNANK